MCNDYNIKRKIMLNQLIQYTKLVQMIYTYSVNSTTQKLLHRLTILVLLLNGPLCNTL